MTHSRTSTDPEDPMRLQISAMTNRGLVREINEDAIAVGGWTGYEDMTEPRDVQLSDLKHPLALLVADGLGGHLGGDVASRMIVHELPPVLERAGNAVGIAAALDRMNDRLFQFSAQSPDTRGMGATVAGVLVDRTQAFIFNVGDARVYVLAGGELLQLSVDDIPEFDAVDQMRRSHFITQSLGGTDELVPIRPHIDERTISPKEGLLLCSDGITDVLSADEILAGDRGSPRESVQAISRHVLEKGAPDNFSIILCRFA